MKLKASIVFLILGSWVTLTFAANQCAPTNCFDCDKCNKSCNEEAVKQNCDTDCMIKVRTFLCKMENENCVKVNGCDVPPVSIVIYPAANYDESRTEWKAQTIKARKNCCYKLSGIYDNTLSGLKTSGACVQLFDNSDCTGASLTVDSKWSAECLKWIDCPSRLSAGGAAYNDKASSFKLC